MFIRKGTVREADLYSSVEAHRSRCLGVPRTLSSLTIDALTSIMSHSIGLSTREVTLPTTAGRGEPGESHLFPARQCPGPRVRSRVSAPRGRTGQPLIAKDAFGGQHRTGVVKGGEALSQIEQVDAEPVRLERRQRRFEGLGNASSQEPGDVPAGVERERDNG